MLRNKDVSRFQALLVNRSIVWAAVWAAFCTLLILACTAGATSSAPLPTAQPMPTQIPTPTPTPTPTPASTPAQAGRASAAVTGTPSGPPTVSPQQSVRVDPVFIQLTDPLDEPEYYCLDVPGAGPGVSLQSALQVHTCKTRATAADELFTLDHPGEGQIYMEAYDLCVEAEGAEKGFSLRLQDCSDSPHQLFAFEENVIRLSGGGQDGLCLAVAPGLGIPTGGPSHLRRALTLEGCETTEPTLTHWSVALSVPTDAPLRSSSQTQVAPTPLPMVTTKPVPSSSPYTNELWDYTILVPNSWAVVDTSLSSVIIIEYLEDGSLVFVDIEVEPVRAGLTTKEYADQKIAEGGNPESFASYNLDSLTQVTIAGRDAWKATETFEQLTGGSTRTGDEYFFVANGVGYGIFAESDASKWSSMEPIFSRTVQSLTLN